MDKYSMEELIKRIENCDDLDTLRRLRAELVSADADDEETKVLKSGAVRKFT